MKHALALSLAAAALAAGAAAPVQAQSQPFLGQITAYAFDWCPRGWARADGTLLPIDANQSLFSLYGTIYGGDGRTTFALPDMRGRMPISAGVSPGTSTYPQGRRGGADQIALTAAQMASHSHAFNGTTDGPNTLSINNATLATFPSNRSAYADPAALPNQMNGQMIHSTGGGQPFDIRQPYITVQYCVALQGQYPSRN